ncbi:conserved hypothetical protein [Escherichia coli TA280]|nr:conserved hypothetical protein [Escherichia coli TA280]
MRTRIDYLADKYSFTELNKSPRLRRQWQDVLEECRQTEAGPEERLRIALLNVDYVTSFELPFRLLLTRTPQLIAALREEWGISQKNVVFNDVNATMFDRYRLISLALTPIRRQLVLPTGANYTGRPLHCNIKSRLLLPLLSFSCSFPLSVRTYIRDGSVGLPPPPP